MPTRKVFADEDMTKAGSVRMPQASGDRTCLFENLRQVMLQMIDVVLHQILERDRIRFRDGLESDLLQSVQRARRVQLGLVGVRHQVM